MLRICIVDDERESVNNLKKYLLKYFTAHEQQFEVTVFDDGSKLVKNYIPVYDIIFLDIEMPVLDGMKAAAVIRETDREVVIIFLTRLAQFAVKGYEVSAFDYIVKPVDYNSFEIKLTRAIGALSRRSDYKAEIRTAREHLWLPSSQIYYIEVDKHMVTYHAQSGVYTVRGSLAELEKKLSPYGFRLCSRYCLVNMKYVTGLYDWYILVNGERLEVSRNKRKAMLEALIDAFGGGKS